MSLYIRLLTNFYTHRKTRKLRGLIGNDAYWVPPRLWAYAAEHQPDGDLSGHTDADIAAALGVDAADASRICQALLQAGFLDPNRHLHDWGCHNGYHETYAARARKAAEARWAKVRQDDFLNPGVSRASTGEKDKDRIGQERKRASIAQAVPQASSAVASKESPRAPMTTPERITLDRQIGILKQRLKDLEEETSEQWQRDLNPGLVQEKKRLREQITELENRLLKA